MELPLAFQAGYDLFYVSVLNRCSDYLAYTQVNLYYCDGFEWDFEPCYSL